MNYLEFLSALDSFCHNNPGIQAAAIVGSHARGQARDDSDIDVVLLTDNALEFCDDVGWLELFEQPISITPERYGPMRGLRVYFSELEVEFGFCKSFWAATPVDPGTAEVVRGGFTIVYDPNSQLAKLQANVEEGCVTEIRTHQASDYKSIANVFYDAVQAIDEQHYSLAQKQAWAPKTTQLQLEKWQKRVEVKRPFVALYNDQIIGFAELEIDGHIDCFYMHPSMQNSGIAGQLYQALENEARGFGLKQLHVEASTVAKDFFGRRGFIAQHENSVQIGSEQLTNITMEKILDDK